MKELQIVWKIEFTTASKKEPRECDDTLLVATDTSMAIDEAGKLVLKHLKKEYGEDYNIEVTGISILHNHVVCV